MGAIWKRSQRRPCASWQKKKQSATGSTCEKSQRQAQHAKEVSDGLVRAGKKISDMRNLGKTQRRGRPGKKSAMCAHWQSSQRRIRASWQKISATGAIWEKNHRRAQHEKEVSDGLERADKKISDMRNLGQTQRRGRPGKKSAMCAHWQRSQRRIRASWQKISAMGAIWEKSRRHAQPRTQSATGATCEKIPRRAQPEKEFSDGLNLGKNQRLAHRAPSANWKVSQRGTRVSWQKKSTTGTTWKKKRWVQSEKEVSDGLVRAGKKNQRQSRPVKRVSDKRNMKKKSATALSELAKKSVTGATWEKVSDVRTLTKKSATDSCELAKNISDGRDLGKKSATCATWRRSRRRTRATWRKVSDMRNLGHNQRQARPVKKFRDGRNLKKKSAMGLTWEKTNDWHILKKNSATCPSELSKKIATGTFRKRQRRVQPEKEVSVGLVQVGDGRGLWKKSATGANWKRSLRRTGATWKKKKRRGRPGKKSAMCAHWQRSQRRIRASWKKISATGTIWEKTQRHAQPGTQSATGATCEKIPRRAQPEKEFSDGLNLGKNQRLAHRAPSANWKVSQRGTGASWQKKSATEKSWKRSQRHEKEVSDGLERAGKKISDMRNLGKTQRRRRPGKKSAMCAHWQKSQRRIRAGWQKISATGAIWEKSQRRAQPEEEVGDGLVRHGEKSATCATWDTISDRRDLWKNSATGATWKRSQWRA